MGWTEERVAELKKLWAEGHSASQIAKRLGSVTRNAVIGKVHRLGNSPAGATPSRPVKRPPRLAQPKPQALPRQAQTPVSRAPMLSPSARNPSPASRPTSPKPKPTSRPSACPMATWSRSSL